jgi:hypothetical protein
MNMWINIYRYRLIYTQYKHIHISYMPICTNTMFTVNTDSVSQIIMMGCVPLPISSQAFPLAHQSVRLSFHHWPRQRPLVARRREPVTVTVPIRDATLKAFPLVRQSVSQSVHHRSRPLEGPVAVGPRDEEAWTWSGRSEETECYTAGTRHRNAGKFDLVFVAFSVTSVSLSPFLAKILWQFNKYVIS